MPRAKWSASLTIVTVGMAIAVFISVVVIGAIAEPDDKKRAPHETVTPKSSETSVETGNSSRSGKKLDSQTTARADLESARNSTVPPPNPTTTIEATADAVASADTASSKSKESEPASSKASEPTSPKNPASHIPESIDRTQTANPRLNAAHAPLPRNESVAEMIVACKAAMTFESSIGRCVALGRPAEVVSDCGRATFDSGKLKCIELAPDSSASSACTKVLSSDDPIAECVVLRPSMSIATACHRKGMLDSAILGCIRSAISLRQTK